MAIECTTVDVLRFVTLPLLPVQLSQCVRVVKRTKKRRLCTAENILCSSGVLLCPVAKKINGLGN